MLCFVDLFGVFVVVFGVFVVVFGVTWLYLRYSRISSFVCLCFWCVGCIMIRIAWHRAVFCGYVWCVLWLCLVCFVVVFGVLWLYLRYSRISCFVCLCFWCVGCIMIRISWHRAVFCGYFWCVLWLCLVCFVVVFGVLWLYLQYSRISCFVCLCFLVCWVYNDKDILASCCVLWLCLVCFVVVFGVFCGCVWCVMVVFAV